MAFLVALAFAVAASANLPAILYSLFWKRFNTRGAVWSIYGGLISAVGAGVLLAGRVRQGDPRPAKRRCSPAPTSLVPAENPGIISIPLGFLFGWLGTITSRDTEAERSVQRARGSRPDRRGCREGDGPLAAVTARHSAWRRAYTPVSDQSPLNHMSWSSNVSSRMPRRLHRAMEASLRASSSAITRCRPKVSNAIASTAFAASDA